MVDLATPELGALAELGFQMRCVERGIDCYAPIIGTNKAVDFVINLDGRFVSVQVKKATVAHNLAARSLPRIGATLHGSCRRRYKEAGCITDPADFYAFVCAELHSIWLIPKGDIQVTQTWSKKLSLRHELDPYLF